jgi:ubiquitin-protein ligase
MACTPQEQRRLRIMSDFEEMKNIRGSIIQWHHLEGDPPFVESYQLSVKVKTIIGPNPSYRENHIITVTLPPEYPIGRPRIIMESNPQPFHPNWWTDRRWCGGDWDLAEGLGHHIIRMIRTLQFDAEITNANSPANAQAKEWYLANQSKGWFPCDRQVLPDPTKSRFQIETRPKPKFVVQ